MDITTKEENGTLTLGVSGRLDTTTAPQLDKTLSEKIGDATELIFDLEGLTYISSAGLRCVLKAQKVMSRQGSMKLTHVSQAIMDILEITGFTDFLTVEADE